RSARQGGPAAARPAGHPGGDAVGGGPRQGPLDDLGGVLGWLGPSLPTCRFARSLIFDLGIGPLPWTTLFTLTSSRQACASAVYSGRYPGFRSGVSWTYTVPACPPVPGMGQLRVSFSRLAQ